MKIEIGKTYEIGNLWKKNIEELQFFKKDDLYMTMERWWRFGKFRVTPQDEYEVEDLQLSYDREDGNGYIEITSFQDYEFIEVWDECAFQIDFNKEVSEQFLEEVEDNYLEEGYSYLEDNGWVEIDPEVFIHGPLEIIEVEVSA